MTSNRLPMALKQGASSSYRGPPDTAPPFEGEPVGCSAKKMWLTALSKDANVEEQDCEYSFSESREPGYTSSKNRRLVNYYGSEKEARTVPGRDMAETMGSLPTSVNERLKLLASGIGKRLN